MMATASDPAPTAHHSPRGSGSAAVEGNNSPQYRRRGGSGGVSTPWTQIGRGADSELTSYSSSPAAAASATVGISIAPPPPPSFSPSLSGVAEEEQVMNNFSSDRSPSKAGAEAAVAAASTSFLPEEGAGEAQHESSENGSGGGGNAAKKPAWNMPSSGAPEVGPVMDAVSWPALSESTRASPKSSSESLKTLLDGSVPVSQGTGATSPSAHKQGTNNNANSNSTPNHAPYNRQRSMKRGGGNPSNSTSVNGGPSQLSSPRGSRVETAPDNSGKPANSAADSSSRDNTHRDGGHRGGFGSQSHSANEHQQPRNSFRRSGGGPHPRGDGSHHHGYGSRRGDQDRGNQDWNSSRSFGSRDSHAQPQRLPSRPFIRGPPPTPPPFMPPTPMPMRPFATPVVYPEVHSPVFYYPGPHPESLRAVPMVPPIPQLFFPLPDPQLPAKIVNQIEYYFSNENLIKDTFLRQNMDDQGWVPIKLIASFKKVMQLTDNIQLILDSVRISSVVEVEGEKVRRRNDWKKWIMPPSVQYSTASSPQSIQKSSQDMLAANLQSIALDDKTATPGYAETYLSPSSSGEWSSLSQQSIGEKVSQVAGHAGFPTSPPNSSK